MREFAAMSILNVWYAHFDVEDALARLKSDLPKKAVRRTNAAAMTGYGRMCGWTLARAHARTGDRIAIAGYLGGSDKFDQAVADFAESHADQTERDHTALADAVASGRVQAQVGI
ncbi:MAG TPA: DUF2252 family protein [Streptosporangiaceae bacterium]|nr:DUF2252 family protein [Streptosporangiaceae bacterium]HLN70979.1 DUF2252 family protein [Streptosporangiaceae bacterium]